MYVVVIRKDSQVIAVKTAGDKFCTNPVILDRKDAREAIWKYF